MAQESLQGALCLGYAEVKVMNSFLYKEKNMVFNVDVRQVTLEGLQEELAVRRAMSQDHSRGNISGKKGRSADDRGKPSSLLPNTNLNSQPCQQRLELRRFGVYFWLCNFFLTLSKSFYRCQPQFPLLERGIPDTASLCSLPGYVFHKSV